MTLATIMIMMERLEDGDDTRDALFVDRVVAVLHSVQVVSYIYTQALMFLIKKQIKVKLQSKFQAKI